MLGYGPASQTTLSPPLASTRPATGARFGNVRVKLLPPAPMTSVHVVITLSLGPTMVLPSHVPAISAGLPPAGAAWGGLLARAAGAAAAPRRAGGSRGPAPEWRPRRRGGQAARRARGAH